MIARIQESDVFHVDDSPVTLLRNRRYATAWVYLGVTANPFTLFDFTNSRSQECPMRFLLNFQGLVQGDA